MNINDKFDKIYELTLRDVINVFRPEHKMELNDKFYNRKFIDVLNERTPVGLGIEGRQLYRERVIKNVSDKLKIKVCEIDSINEKLDEEINIDDIEINIDI